MRKIVNILRFIMRHPIGRQHKIKSLYRLLIWQLRQFVAPGERVVQFSQGVKMYVNKNDTGVTGNIYVGIHDFQEIFFALHFLREEDVFVDVGANVGFYTIYLSKIKNIKTISLEPIPKTFGKLLKNIELNHLSDKVYPFNVAVGSTEGSVYMSKHLDTVNHIKLNGDIHEGNISVKLSSLDKIFENSELAYPSLIKIDVEGYETEVINGMSKILHSQQLKAILIELNGSGGRYGYDEKLIHQKLLDHSFQPYHYDPFSRKLNKLTSFGPHNTIYVRDLDFVNSRLESSMKYEVFGESI